MLLALEHYKSHVVDAGGREQKVLAISGYFKKKFHFIKGFVTPPTSSGGRGDGGAAEGSQCQKNDLTNFLAISVGPIPPPHPYRGLI